MASCFLRFLAYNSLSTCQHGRALHILPKFTLADTKRGENEEKMKKIREQGQIVRRLEAEKADAAKIEEEVKKLLALKSQLVESHPAERFVLRTPKGTRDYSPKEMAIRQHVIGVVVECFKRHGANTIDTPVFELKETLTGKYGEEGGKLIYDLGDQTGEQLALRYDLTVPFARYLAMNKIQCYKRYQIAKVYRLDNPAVTRGRYREFYQCDFDIAGTYEPLLPEVECLRITTEILKELDLGDFEIKVNHRSLLDGMMTKCGVPNEKFKSVCSSIDKLDKSPWDDVKKELIDERQVSEETADKIGNYVLLRERNQSLSSTDLLNLLKSDGAMPSNTKKAIEQLEILFGFGELYGLENVLVFDPSLARGLDYYTGTIYEAIVKGYANADEGDCADGEVSNGNADGPELGQGVGSVAGGGRYDSLVGMFDPNKRHVPCVGVSIGIERIFAIKEQKLKGRNEKFRVSDTDIFVASAQKNLMRERMKLCRLLWDAKMKVESSYKANPKLLDQLQYCEEEGIPLALILGQDELQRGVVKIRRVDSREESYVKREELIEELERRIKEIRCYRK